MNHIIKTKFHCFLPGRTCWPLKHIYRLDDDPDRNQEILVLWIQRWLLDIWCPAVRNFLEDTQSPGWEKKKYLNNYKNRDCGFNHIRTRGGSKLQSWAIVVNCFLMENIVKCSLNTSRSGEIFVTPISGRNIEIFEPGHGWQYSISNETQ